MLTPTQISLHEKAITLLKNSENHLAIMKALKDMHDESSNEFQRERYAKRYDHNAGCRMALMVQYTQVLKELFAPFGASLIEEGTPPEPHVPRISAVQLAESFYEVPSYNVIP